MSVIFNTWTCKYCKKVYEKYVSFGHPVTCFDVEWTCEECKETNTRHVFGNNFCDKCFKRDKTPRRKVNIKIVDDVSKLGQMTKSDLLAESEKFDPENYNSLEQADEKIILIPENKSNKELNRGN